MNRKSASKAQSGPPSGIGDVSEFDREFVIDTFQPLDAESARLWRRVKRKRGRPTIGKGVKVISVSIERRLLKQADQLAKKQRVSRAHLIGRGLRAVLAEEGVRSKSGS